MSESLARDKNVGLLGTTPILWNKRVKSKGKRIGTSKKEKTTLYSTRVRGAGREGEGEGAGAWTCARATAWNSQHWLREGAWWIEGVSHRPSAQRRARKLAERTVIAIVCVSMNEMTRCNRTLTRASRRDATRCDAPRGDPIVLPVTSTARRRRRRVSAFAADRGREVRRRFL